MNQAIQPQNGALALSVSPEDALVLEAVVVGGDLSRLSAVQRVAYYRMRCDAAQLDPRTQPFAYITLQGKLTLYATKTATEQLCETRNISTAIATREALGDIYIVTCRASLPSGRFTDATGAVNLAAKKGDDLANAYMKAETKAKRRAVLALCGLGMMDETEKETVAGAQTFAPAELHAEPAPEYEMVKDITKLSNAELRSWCDFVATTAKDHPQKEVFKAEFLSRKEAHAAAKAAEPEAVEGEVLSRFEAFKREAPEQFLVFLGACQARKLSFETDADIAAFEEAAANNLDRPVIVEQVTNDEWEALAEGVREWGLKWEVAA